MGRPNLKRDSGSLLTRAPLPLAISLASATTEVRISFMKGLDEDASPPTSAAGDAQIAPARNVAATAPLTFSSIDWKTLFLASRDVVDTLVWEGAKANTAGHDASSAKVVNFILFYK